MKDFNYYTGVASLREQVLSVVASALLQQGSLELDQIHTKLPDYVPPKCVTAIARHLEAQLECFPSKDLFPMEPADPIHLEELEMTTPEGLDDDFDDDFDDDSDDDLDDDY